MSATARVAVRRLAASELEAYRALMLRAYEAEPAAFTVTRAERAAMPRSWWLQRVADPQGNGVGFGAFDGERLAGVVALAFATDDAGVCKATLRGLYVEASMRGLGLGRKLLETALAHARERGARVAELGVIEGNHAACALYRALGFVPFRRESLAAAEHVWWRLDLEPATAV